MSGESGRVGSVDALRGFDMFFITGGAALVSGVCSALGCADCWLAVQMKHVAWTGLAQHDTIFPLFLFLAGVSWPFSLAAQEGRGRSRARIQLRVALRALVLFLIGLSFGGILDFKPNFRLMSVLGYIGASWALAATAYLHVRSPRSLFALACALLAGYCAMLHFAAPGAPPDAWSYSPEWNLPAYFDRCLWPSHTYKGGHDPESFFAVPSGIAMALFGMLAGARLRKDRSAPGARTSLVLLAWAGAASVAACAFALLLGDPVVKKLWTSSFVLATCAYSLAMLALFHWIVDVRGWRRWTVAFDPVGKNSILAYVLMMTGVQHALGEFLFSGVCDHAGEWRGAVGGLASYLVVWSVLLYLRRREVFLKV